jgi:ADP-dependent NAD(P)H-hydrate dehydratase
MHPLRHADPQELDATLLDDALLRAWPLPLDEDGDKLTRGTVLVIAGSTTTAGAALLAGTAALRMGAGRLQIATAEPIAMNLSIAMPEAMVLPLAVDEDNHLLPEQAANTLSDHIAAAQSVLVGPGMDSPAALDAITGNIAERLSPEAVVVVDAAALRAVTSAGDCVRGSLARRLLLTPNRDELEVLVNSLAVADQSSASMGVSRELGAVTTCFGEVTSYDGRMWRADPATPGLGTSGSGDVLAGLAAGAAARCGDPSQAACWATYVHACAGNRLSARLGTTSFIARELLDEVPRLLADFD